jgi:hypothetical protein
VDLHARFLSLLPKIETHARIFFRQIACAHRKADAVQEMKALAWKWFVRLCEQGKDAEDFPTVFTSLLARAVNSGRRLAGMEKSNDVMNPQAQRRSGFTVEALPISTKTSHEELYGQVHGQKKLDAFDERLRDNTQTPVDEQAAFRIDFLAWLNTLTGRERRIIRAMALNERTKDLSREFALSPWRISQLRQEFRLDWNRFCACPAEVV